MRRTVTALASRLIGGSLIGGSFIGSSFIGSSSGVAMVAVAVFAPHWAVRACAQTLDLDGVPAGPAIPAENAARELARSLAAEATALEAQAARLAGEARHSALARARIRQVGQLLLELGADRPWSDSAAVVAGLRISSMTSRTDRLLEHAARGERFDGTSLPAADARAALDALAALAGMSFDAVRAATAGADIAPEALAHALARTLGPLAVLARLVEGASLETSWPTDGTAGVARSAGTARPETRPEPRAETRPRGRDEIAMRETRGDPAQIASEIAQLPEGPAREAARLLLERARGGGVPDARLLRAVASAVDTLGWIAAIRTSERPWPLADEVVDAIERRARGALETLASAPADESGGEGADVRAAQSQLDSLAAVAGAIEAMIAMRDASWANDLDRRALGEACASLAAAEVPDAATERARLRVAQRIEEACAAAARLLAAEQGDAPGDLRDVTRAIDRDARPAIRALPKAFAALAADPMRAADPERLSAVVRVTTLAADRARVVELHALAERIAGIQPKAGRGIARVVKRLAFMLLDPIKREEAQAGFAAMESLAGSALPFPFEQELQRRTDRAMALTGGEAERVLAFAAELRIAWADELASGRINGPAAARLDLVARYLAALRDAAPVASPITRGDGDRLAMWGGWAARRALLAPATVDLDARALLATRSLLAFSGDRRQDAGNGELSTLERDVETLERSLPVVRLAARFERALASSLEGDPDSVAAALAPIVQAPAPDAAFLRAHRSLLTLARALLEAEQARRTSDGPRGRDIAVFLAQLATDIETTAFGPRTTVGRPIVIETDERENGRRSRSGSKRE